MMKSKVTIILMVSLLLPCALVDGLLFRRKRVPKCTNPRTIPHYRDTGRIRYCTCLHAVIRCSGLLVMTHAGFWQYTRSLVVVDRPFLTPQSHNNRILESDFQIDYFPHSYWFYLNEFNVYSRDSLWNEIYFIFLTMETPTFPVLYLEERTGGKE